MPSDELAWRKRTRHSKRDVFGILRVDFDILFESSETEGTNRMGRVFHQVDSMGLEQKKQ
jgi:hypothetical protein